MKKKSTKVILGIVFLLASLFITSCDQVQGLLNNLQYTITYESEFGTAPSTATKASGTILTANDLPELIADGHTFGGWYLKGTATKITAASNYAISSNITLVAKWDEKINSDPNPNDPASQNNPIATISIQDLANPINIDKNYLWVEGQIDYNQQINYQFTTDITSQFTSLPKAGDTIKFTWKGVSDIDIKRLMIRPTETSEAVNFWAELIDFNQDQCIIASDVKKGTEFNKTLSFTLKKAPVENICLTIWYELEDAPAPAKIYKSLNDLQQGSKDTPTSSENGHLTFTNLTLYNNYNTVIDGNKITYTSKENAENGWAAAYWVYDDIEAYDKIRITLKTESINEYGAKMQIGALDSSDLYTHDNSDEWVQIDNAPYRKTVSYSIKDFKNGLDKQSFNAIEFENCSNNGDWNNNGEKIVWGDNWSVTIEKIELFKLDKNKEDKVLFDPNVTGFTAPASNECTTAVVEKLGQKYLKITTNDWGNNVHIFDSDNSPDLSGYLYYKIEAYTDKDLENMADTHAGIVLANYGTDINETGYDMNRSCDLYIEKPFSEISIYTAVVDTPSFTDINPYIQTAGSPIDGHSIYIGRIVATNNENPDYLPFKNLIQDWHFPQQYEGETPIVREPTKFTKDGNPTINGNSITTNGEYDVVYWNLNNFADWENYDVVTLTLSDISVSAVPSNFTIKVNYSESQNWDVINIDYPWIEPTWRDLTYNISDLKERFKKLGISKGQEKIGIQAPKGSSYKLNWIIFGKYAHQDDLVIFDPGADGFIAPEGTSVETIDGEKYLKVTSDGSSNGTPIALSKSFNVTEYQGFKAKYFVKDADKTENDENQFGFSFMLSYDENHDENYDEWVQNLPNNDTVKNIQTELKSHPISLKYPINYPDKIIVKVNEIRYWTNKNGYNGDWTDIGGKTFYIGKVVAYTER